MTPHRKSSFNQGRDCMNLMQLCIRVQIGTGSNCTGHNCHLILVILRFDNDLQNLFGF